MGKVIYTKQDEKGELNLVVGNVTYVREGKSGQLYIGVTLDIWDKESKAAKKAYLSISAWDNTPKGGKNMVDRIRKAKMSTGSFASFLTGTVEEEPAAEDGTPRMRASLIDFKYSARWKFGDGDAEKNIIVGTVARVSDRDGDTFGVSIPVDRSLKMEDGSYETEWFSVTFKNGEYANMADRARKILEKGKTCAVYCSKMRQTENNGRVYNDLFGNEIVLAARRREDQSA